MNESRRRDGLPAFGIEPLLVTRVHALEERQHRHVGQLHVTRLAGEHYATRAPDLHLANDFDAAGAQRNA